MFESLKAVILATITDPALAQSLIAKITEQKFTVRTAAEEEAFKTNLLATVNKEEIISAEKAIWMRRIEDDVREITGLKQNPSEPYHQFMKRGFKALQDKVAEIEREKEALESNKGTGDAAVWKTKYETLEKQSKEALAAKDATLAELNKSVETSKRRTELDKAFAPIRAKFVDQLPGYFKDYEENVINEVLAKSAIIDGKLVLVDEAGNPRKDGNLANILVEQHLTEKFKDVIKTDQQQAGAGTGPAGEGKNPGAAAAPAKGVPFNTATIPSTITTQAQLTEHLGKAGLLQGSKEFDEAFTKTVQEKNITKVF